MITQAAAQRQLASSGENIQPRTDALAYHFSRFLGILNTEEGLGHLQKIFEELAERLRQQIDGLDKYAAIDGTPFCPSGHRMAY